MYRTLQNYINFVELFQLSNWINISIVDERNEIAVTYKRIQNWNHVKGPKTGMNVMELSKKVFVPVLHWNQHLCLRPFTKYPASVLYGRNIHIPTRLDSAILSDIAEITLPYIFSYGKHKKIISIDQNDVNMPPISAADLGLLQHPRWNFLW